MHLLLMWTCLLAGSQPETTPAQMTSPSSAAEGVALVGVASDGDHAQLFTSRPVFVRKPLSASVVEGDPVKVTCQVQGHPRPRVRWIKDGKPVETTSNARVKVSVSLRYVVSRDHATRRLDLLHDNVMFVFQHLADPNRACLAGVYAVTLDPLLSLYGIIYVTWYTRLLPKATSVTFR